MDDPLAVGFIQGVGDLDAAPQHLFGRESALEQPLGQRLAFQELHDEVLDAVLVAHVVERADVGMRERRDGLGFSLETLANLLVLRKMRGEDLDRDRALQPRVLRFVDLAHPSRAYGGEDLVGTEAGAGCEGHAAIGPEPRRPS